ncbi:FecR domain-containing protein [Chloroflexota bacterium]
MRSDFKIILEQCIERLRQGSSIEVCLSEYPEYREKLEPLLHMVLRLSAFEEVQPSPEFMASSKERVLDRIRQIKAESQNAERNQISFIQNIYNRVSEFFQYPVSLKSYIVPASVVTILAILVSVGQFLYIRPSAILAAPCILNVFSGNVEIRAPDADEWLHGTNRMILEAGTVIKTQESSHAILTFFSGSTSVKLEPETEVIIQQLDKSDEIQTIALLQNDGKTWSFVGSSASGEINYQVNTSSASAIAMGTLFTVEIDDDGSTVVATTEGEVKVTAEDSQVLLGKLQKVTVKSGEALPSPSSIYPPVTAVTIFVENGIATSITDPNGFSTGNLESGIFYNQIIGSQSILSSEGPQVITIPEPVNGEYLLLLSCKAPGVTGFDISITSDDKEVFRYNGSFLTSQQKLWLVYLDMFVEDGIITGAAVDEVEALRNENVDEIITVSPSVKEQEKAKSESAKNKELPEKKEKQENDKGQEADDNTGGDNTGKDQNQKDKDNGNKDNQSQDKSNNGNKDNQSQDKSNNENKDNQSQDKSSNNNKDGTETDKQKKDIEKDNKKDSSEKESGNKNKDKEDK